MEDKTHTLSLTDIHCSSCVQTIESTLNASPQVQSASVNFAEKTVGITGTLDESAIIDLIAKAGYAATAITEDEASTPTFSWFWQSALPLLWGAILLALAYCPALTLQTSTGAWLWRGLGLITLFVLIKAGSHFYQHAWQSLKRGRSTMDTLIALGTGCAFLFSSAVVLLPGLFEHAQQVIYFDACVLILGLVNLGGFLENRATHKTTDAIKTLTALQPKTAIIVHNGSEKMVDISQLNKGDIIRIKPGAQVPIDGIVESGNTSIDEAMLTGEAMPVQKQKGDSLFGGTINQKGAVLMRVTATGKDTALAHIIEAVRQAQKSKPPIAKMADKICSVFVPCVLIIAVITGVIWYYAGGTFNEIILATLSVLVIACPCAIGLASPIAVMLGTGQAAKSGLLIRSGEAIERMPKIDTIVFDKTGTITEGNMRVTEMLLLNSDDKDTALLAAASVENNSEHPLAQAIISYAQSMNIAPTQVEDFQSDTGMGVECILGGDIIRIGKLAYLEKHTIDCSGLATLTHRDQYAAFTLVYLAINTKALGVFAISDPIKESTKETMLTLQKLGLKTIMLTGDQENIAKHIASQINIDQVYSNVLAVEKQSVIKELQQNGACVAMVGDGINDAPALSQADIGIAIGTGTDIAMAAADIVLMRKNLSGVIEARTICTQTLRIIKQNFLGSFAYNSVGILIAAGVFYPWLHWLLSPWMASAAMALSSITVVLNASRLQGKK